ncbi:hypothetical protein LCGC14_0706000 [marine sediment metagenome]|uniref:Uncharacterized protein n=1 Tax=marine sediment metagenome TaxID=412755 RepID=A0A0F9QL09_9ZZZZ|nr:hypothetical protein [bacterium]
MNIEIESMELILQDISRNYNDYDRSKLLKIIGQFQNQILNLKRADVELVNSLNDLSLIQIKNCQKKLNLELLSPPKQKIKLIPIISSLALQKKKKRELLESAKSLKTFKSKRTAKSMKKLTTASDADLKDLGKSWLTYKNLSHLESDLTKTNMNEIRAVVKPWKLKPAGRTKIALITAVLDYIKRMKKLSKLGT